MLGVLNPSGSHLKKTDAYIDVSVSPRQQEQRHNNPATCPRVRRAFAGQWELCVVIPVPAARRLDVCALAVFWRTRSRTLEKRITFGIQLARSLKLECWANMLYATEIIGHPLRQVTDGLHTINGPPLCRSNETVCFTIGSASANSLTRPSTELAESDEPVEVDWMSLARIIVHEPTTPLDTTSQTIQANTLELMMHSTDDTERAASEQLVKRVKRISVGPVTRTNTGFAKFEQLRDAVETKCCNSLGEIDDARLFTLGDSCYSDISEFWSRKLERVPIHKADLCACGARYSPKRRIKILKSTGRSSFSYVCSECGRLSAASIVLQPNLQDLRQNVGAAASPSSASTLLQCYDASCSLSSVNLDDDDPQPGPSIGSSATAVSNALPLKRKQRNK